MRVTERGRDEGDWIRSRQAVFNLTDHLHQTAIMTSFKQTGIRNTQKPNNRRYNQNNYTFHTRTMIITRT